MGRTTSSYIRICLKRFSYTSLVSPSLFLESAFTTLSRFNDAWVSLTKSIPKLDRKRQDYFLGHQWVKPGIQSKRQSLHRADSFFAQLLDSVGQKPVVNEGDEEADSEPPAKRRRTLQTARRSMCAKAPPKTVASMAARKRVAPAACDHMLPKEGEVVEDEHDKGKEEYDAADKPENLMESKQILLHLLSAKMLVNITTSWSINWHTRTRACSPGSKRGTHMLPSSLRPVWEAGQLLGQAHVDMMLATLEWAQRTISSEDGTAIVVAYLNATLGQRFGLTDILDGYFFFPTELGGLEFQSLFIGLLQIGDALPQDPSHLLDDSEEAEAEAYRTAKIKFEEDQVYRHDLDDASSVSPDADTFVSFEESTQHREKSAYGHGASFTMCSQSC